MSQLPPQQETQTPQEIQAPQETQTPQETMQKLLVSMAQLGASDLHLKVRIPPYFRVAGHLRKVNLPPISDSAYIEQMMAELVPPSRREEYAQMGDLDFSARIASGDRFRINIYRSTGEMHAAIRRVQRVAPTFEELHLPTIYKKVISESMEGLILVAGVTGSGKSSTLAAMVQHINEHRGMHIVTIEDPIEYVFEAKKSIVSQREIGIDVPDYPTALKFAVRQDPDCIFIGEMRDKDTMLAALQAAETGHLVLGSIHCSDVSGTFSRILEFFSRSQHAFIRSSLANSLKAIMCQKLLPGIEPDTRFPATEALLNNTIVKDKIVREEDDELQTIIVQSAEEGMRAFADSLCELIETERVHYDTAMDYAPNREALASRVKGIKASSATLVGRLKPGR